MRPNTILRSAAVLGGLAVGLGAFGAHALKERLSAELLVVFETGVRYQMYHALALLAAGVLAATGRRTGPAAICFLAGIALFSGSLYALALLGVKWLGAITPVGGVCFLLGWLLLAVRAADVPGANEALERVRSPS